MLIASVRGAVLNAGVGGHRGFDAFAESISAAAEVWALADGANSCPQAGVAARWLVDEAVGALGDCDNADAVKAGIMDLHRRMQVTHPETAATLVLARRTANAWILSSVGDSRLWCFHQRPWPFSSWSPTLEMPLDLDAQGHPSQLVGSEVCTEVHVRQIQTRNPALVVLASDGAGNWISPQEISQHLALIGRRRPSKDDLHYLCDTLARTALDRGSDDDISVVMIWSEG